MRIAVPDLISPSYFPAIAAVELGLVRDEGLDIELELLFPVTDAAHALRTGKIDFLAGAAHAPMHAFPEWSGVKLVAALSQHMYWFLVVRSDLNIGRGELDALRDMRIGAAPGPDLGLRLLLADASIDIDQRGIHIGPVPAAEGTGVSFGVAAAQALETGVVDAFWANGMGAELAVQRGTGSLVLDARRGDGPSGATGYTFPALATTDQTIEREPDAVAAVTRAIVRAQRLLAEDPQRATEAATELFPALETSMIAELVRRDAPFYDPTISAGAAGELANFGLRTNLITTTPTYDQIVSPQFRHLWQ